MVLKQTLTYLHEPSYIISTKQKANGAQHDSQLKDWEKSSIFFQQTPDATDGSMQYLLEVEMAETRCKKYLPIIDQSKCPVDPSEEQIVCQVRS